MATTGKVITERRGGSTRFRLDFGRIDGVRMRLDSVPSPADGKPVAFADLADANRWLERIRAEVANGATLRAVLGHYRRSIAPNDRVSVRLVKWVEHNRRLVASGQRSPTTLREYERYAQPDGHLSWWGDCSIHMIRRAELEDFHAWLGARGISPKTQKNVSDAFRAMLRWLHLRGELAEVPRFPTIRVPDYAPRTVTIEQQTAVLEAIPWPKRGAFLLAATEGLRLGELRALDLADYVGGRIHWHGAVQGPRVDAPTADRTKNRGAVWIEPWSPELQAWLAWRIEQATPESRLRGEVALVWNPDARNVAKRWTPSPLESTWARACELAGVSIPFQQGTRHTTATALGAVFSDRLLQAWGRWKDGKSVAVYSRPKPAHDALVRVLRPGAGPQVDPGQNGGS